MEDRLGGGTTNRLCEEEKGVELEKRGPSSVWDRGRNCQVGGMTDMWTGKERGREGWSRDGGTEPNKEDQSGGV